MNTIVLIDSGNTRLKVGVIGDRARDTGSAPDRNAGDRSSHAADGGLSDVDDLDEPVVTTDSAHDGKVGACIGGVGTGRGNWSGDLQASVLDQDDVQSLKDWLAALPGPPVAALGTNVAGEARAAIIEAAFAEIRCPIRWIAPQAQAYGLTSRYTRPEQLGADRWVSMLGVLARRDAVMHASSCAFRSSESRPGSATGARSDHARQRTAGPSPAGALAPFLLASFGTATTLDTVSGENVFEGGLILPGPAMMRRSLASGTANLPLADGDAVVYPTDTQHAIASGVAAAQAGAVLRQWLAGLRRYGDAPHIYVAGGGWQEVEPETRRLLTDTAAAMGRLPPPIHIIENPVLHGLVRIAATINLGQT